MKKIFYFLIVGFIMASCQPTKTLVDTSCSGYKKTDFSRDAISSQGIGIMPVLGGGNKEQYRRPMGDAINKYFNLEFDVNNVRSTQEVITLINNEGLSDEYSKAINDYQTTGIIHKEIVTKLGEALNVTYLLYSKLLSDTEISSFYTGYSYDLTSIDEIYVQCQVWDTKAGDVVWEGKGGVAKLEQNPSNVIEVTAEGLSKVIGLEAYEGSCEESKELIIEVQKAYTNTIVAGTLVSSALAILLVLIIL